MCGLFGVVLPRNYPAEIPVGFAISYLGVSAEERGRDAAGVAVLGRNGGWQVAKTLGGFRRLHREHRGLPETLSTATIVLGHTRWATQGGRGLAQASPIKAGRLLGTHNGDVDPATIPGWAGLPIDPGATDSHYLFQALAAAHRRRGLTKPVLAIVSAMRGRAALVWTDTGRADHQLWLARAGLSPLAIGVDQYGGLWWASNPAWMREMADQVGLQITITLLPEGSLWTALPHRAHVNCALVAEFKPTVRRRDLAVAGTAVWRGFDRTDTAADHDLLRHRTVA